jgi:hypothetical protein
MGSLNQIVATINFYFLKNRIIEKSGSNMGDVADLPYVVFNFHFSSLFSKFSYYEQIEKWGVGLI